MDFKKMNEESNDYMKDLFKESPERFKHFKDYMSQALNAGTLGLKTKELIVVAIAVKVQCTYCIALHVKKALDAGATKEELIDVVHLTIMMGGGPALMYGQEVIKAIKEFKE